jgi:membrane fusion protein, multidrug efflux system
VDLGTKADSIAVPERAVTELQGKNFVWTVASDNKVTQRTVKVGGQLGENLLILEGLKPGDRIVVEGLQKVKEGAPVEPKTAAQIAEASSTATNALTKTGRE